MYLDESDCSNPANCSDSDVELAEKEDKQFEFTKWIILKEDSYFMVVWKLLIILACVVSGYYYAWVATFGYEIWDPRLMRLHYWIEWIMEPFFAVDIILNFTPQNDISMPLDNIFQSQLSNFLEGCHTIIYITID